MRKSARPILLIPALCGLFSALSAQDIILSNPSSCGLNIALSDNSCPENNPNVFTPDVFGIQVSGAPGAALGVDVYLKEVRIILAHTWMSDVGITLVSPGGRSVLLAMDNGGSGDNLGNPDAPSCSQYAVFSAGACTPVSQGAPPYTDRPYLPMQSLLSLNDSTTSPNGLWLLQICDDVPNDVGALQFVELVFEPLSCLPVEQIQILNIDTTTVALNWQAGGDCSNIIIEYGQPGFVPGTGFASGEGAVEPVMQCPPYLLMNLLPDTEYDIYIRRFCPGGGFSGNGCPVRVRTGCQPPPTTIVETFDAATPCFPNCAAVCNINGFWRNVGGDDFDWLIYQGATPTPNTGPLAGVHGSGRYAYIETSGVLCNNGRSAILESNCVRLRKFGSDECHLSFNYHMFGANINTLRLQVSGDGGFSWATVWQRSGNQGNEWKKAYISLGEYPEGAILKFRFFGAGGNGSLGDIAIDQIVLHGSEDLGQGAFIYYVDNDNDGYGRSDLVIQSCSPTAPPGYAVQGGDCNDTNPGINPGHPEIPCNGADDNCNGMDDDLDLPPPAASSAAICSGEQVELCAQAAFGGFLLWYSTPEGFDSFVDFGACISPAIPPNNSPLPVTHYFYVEEFAPPCISPVRTQVAVTVNPLPDAAPVPPVSICPGRPLNLAEIDIVDNNFTGAAVTYHAASPATPSNLLPSAVVNPVQPSTYYFLLSTPAGCKDEGPIDVTLRPSPQLSFSPADSFSLCKDGMQLVTAVASGGAGGYQYLWSTGNQTPSITVSAGAAPGDLDAYYLTVTDAAGCLKSDTVLVRTTNSIDSLQRSITHVSTCGGSNGSISLNPLNGLPPFNYVWTSANGVAGSASGINGAYTITGLPQGTYRVTVTDSSTPPCPFILRQIFVNGPDAVVSPPIITPVSCTGASNGAVCLNVSGAASPQYLWNTGATTSCISGLPGGTYSVTVTSGACQTTLNDIVVPEPDSLKAFGELHMPSCSGSVNGSILLSVFGGTPPYQYAWSTGAQSRDITGLGAGSYAVTVTDSRNCSVSRTFSLAAPPPLQVAADSIRHPACFGENSGFIRVIASGGTGPYQYLWSAGVTSAVLFQAAAGLYTVTATDLNGCQAVLSIPLSQPAPLDLATVQVLHPECLGSTDGLVSVSGSGGTMPYSYEWSDGQSGQTIQNLEAGLYTVTFTDAGNCPAIVRSFVLEPQSVLQLQITRVQPTCEGRNDGSITLEPAGTPPFSFMWADDGSQGATRTEIGSGLYEVFIMDGRGCRYDTAVVLSAPQVFDVQMNIISPACFNGVDGAIDLTLVQAGTEPFVFQWDNGSMAEDLIGVPAGIYTLTITDADGCRFQSDPVEITDPAPLVMELLGIGQVLCSDDSTGFIEVEVSGGTPPYTNPSLYGIPAGSYFLQATDSRSCPVNLTVNLPAPPPLNLQVSVVQSSDCQALIQTRLEAVVSGGVPPYRYLWSSGDTTAVILNAAPGDYSLTVQDANGCEKSVGGIKVREQSGPFNIIAFEPSHISCFGAQDGALTVKLTGGSSSYRYHFSNNQIITTPADSVRLSGLGPGSNYRVTVTDVNTGCIKTAGPVSIIQPQPLFYFRNFITNVACSGDQTGAIIASSGGGTSPFQFRWIDAQGNEAGTEEDLTGIGAGVYTGILTDANGCTVTLANQSVVDLYDPLELTDTALVISGAVCSGLNTGAITIAVEGGAMPYQYLWSHGATGPSVSQLPAGTYFVTVTDNVQCQLVLGPYEINESPGIIAGINATPPDSTGANGAVMAIVTGGTPPFRYFWSTGDTTISVQMLGPGSYFLTVTDAAGCTATASAILVHSDELTQPNSVRLYPNPGDGFFYLDFDFPENRINGIVIRSKEGRPVWRRPLPGDRSGREFLHLHALPAGAYVLELHSGGRTVFRQLFVILP